jgi:hypothetical protein
MWSGAAGDGEVPEGNYGNLRLGVRFESAGQV